MARKRLSPAQREREQLAFHYTSALDRADFDAISRILDVAESDPELERIIIEINSALTAIVPHQQGVTFRSGQDTTGDQDMTSVPYMYVSEKRKRSAVRRWAQIAAVITLLLFGGLIVSMLTAQRGSVSSSIYANLGPDSDPSGALTMLEIQNTATAIIVGATQTAASLFMPTPPPMAAISADSCVIIADRAVAMHSRPSEDATVVGGIARGAAASVADSQYDPYSADTWYFVHVIPMPDGVQGWVPGEAFTEAVPGCLENAAARMTYAVGEGDTLASIAGLFNIAPEALRAANNLPVNAVLHVGQVLVIPQVARVELTPTLIFENTVQVDPMLPTIEYGMLPPTILPPAGICPLTLVEPAGLRARPNAEPFTTLPTGTRIEIIEISESTQQAWVRVNVTLEGVRINNAYITSADLVDLLIEGCVAEASPILLVTATPTPAR